MIPDLARQATTTPSAQQPGTASLSGGSLAGHLVGWAPEPVATSAPIHGWPLQAFADLLDQPHPASNPGAPVPLLWHWFAFVPMAAQSSLGEDGHPAAGPFLPPLPHRRRMAAGGRARFERSLRVGEVVERRSTLASATTKVGRSGDLLFTTVRHDYRVADEVVGVEEEDVVYRSQEPGTPRRPTAGQPSAPGDPARWELQATLGPAALFRFSALTYNAHRIHYDQSYAVEVERHPGLVVHGPLLTLLALELPRRRGPRPVMGVSYRYHLPVYAGEVLVAQGHPTHKDAQLVVTKGHSAAVVATATW